MGEGCIPDSVRFSVRATIECVLADDIEPAIASLEATAQETPADLVTEWRQRKAERGE